jgi:hypothetical protein
MNTTAIVDRYIAIWNEIEPNRRRALIAETWTENCRYDDPVLSAEGRDGIEAMVGGFQQQFPGLIFVHTGEIEAHHDRLRFSWDLLAPDGGRVAAGTDVAVVAEDGRLRDVAGFFDQAPVQPDAAMEGATA